VWSPANLELPRGPAKVPSARTAVPSRRHAVAVSGREGYRLRRALRCH
jgi:hypothetical protein